MARPADTRDRLLRAASDLIWTGSYGGTSVDDICAKADVRKGSFYHHFASKCDLAVACFRHGFETEKRPLMDATFSASLPPLRRLELHCQGIVETQAAMAEKYGFVVGCPLFTIGGETCTSELLLRRAIQELIGLILRYFETMIRDGMADGDIPVCDPTSTARTLFAYFEGLLSQARIYNDLTPLNQAYSGALLLLRASPSRVQAA